ncbi:hypothetical protein HPP92_018976 [Vanilla planifolia]|uniref:Uncharacterized protein n=1 Tax=Vanilla planifolia TaxID=51239 RepID=A0A835UPW4_VANPL|nr:hypothetical protein HPP92_018976 [Vanilla planifolia]
MENGIVLGRDKEISSSLQTQKDTAFKANPENISLAFMSRSSGNLSSGPSKEGHISADEPSLNGSIAVEESASTIKNSGIFSTQATMLSSFENRSSLVAVTSAGVCASASDPIQVPSSNDSELLSSCEAGADEKSAASTTNGGISGSRPLGNFSSQAQHANGPLKSGTSKEWRQVNKCHTSSKL